MKNLMMTATDAVANRNKVVKDLNIEWVFTLITEAVKRGQNHVFVEINPQKINNIKDTLLKLRYEITTYDQKYIDIAWYKEQRRT